jgi:uncharacterized protein (TIGR02270 family)
MASEMHSALLLEPEEFLWDVLEEHLEEAYFCIWRFEGALTSALRTLSELPRFEERLVAHLDGLALAGRPGRERLLRAIATPDATDAVQVTVAGLCLLRSSQAFDLLIPVLGHPDARVRGAALRAYQLAAGDGVDRWLLGQVAKANDSKTAASLFELMARRCLAPPVPLKALASDDPALRAAAAGVAVFGERHLYKTALEQLTSDEDSNVRRAALLTSLTWQTTGALGALEQLAFEQADPTLLALFASLVARAQHAPLVSALSEPKLRRPCLYALGFAGDAQHIPLLLEYLQGKDALDAKLAAQSLSLITGIDLHANAHVLARHTARPAGKLVPAEQDPEARAALPPLEEDDLSANLVPAAEAQLPTPHPEGIDAWLRQEAPRFSAPVRFLLGAPYCSTSLAIALERAPLALRHDLALACAIRSQGQARIDTRNFAARQRAQMENLSVSPLTSFLTW